MNFIWNKKNSRLVYCAINVLLVMSLSVACTLAEKSPPQIESIGQIAAAATNAQEGVLLVRKYVSDETSWEYTEARTLYAEARSAYNSWIEQLKADITFGAESNAEKYDSTLADANQKTIDFLKHVGQIEQVHASSGVGSSANTESDDSEREDVVATLILGITTMIVKEVIVGAGVDFWKANQSLKIEEQTKNIEYLDTLLWPSFEAIK